MFTHHTHHSHKYIFFSTSLAVGMCSFLVVLSAWTAADAEMNYLGFTASTSTVSTVHIAPVSPLRAKPEAQIVKAVYLTASSANNTKKLDEIIHLVDTTELNAVVIDIKDYTGNILYDSQVPLVRQLGTSRAVLRDIPAMIQKLHEHHIYVIARQTVFQDPFLSQKKPEWSLMSKNGGLWRDLKGLSWVDAAKEEVWQYNMDIAREAIGLGFDEINFDYIRFPSDGNLKLIQFSKDGPKYDIMRGFYQYVKDTLQDEPAYVSFDMFGLVMDAKGKNDLGIGQRLVDAMGNADYIAPMMYPSHYASGYAGFKNPAEHPGEVFASGLSKGVPVFASSTTQLRPWIQAFNMGAVYDASRIRAQIDQIEKYPNAGWMMWNASNRYTSAGLRTE